MPCFKDTMIPYSSQWTICVEQICGKNILNDPEDHQTSNQVVRLLARGRPPCLLTLLRTLDFRGSQIVTVRAINQVGAGPSAHPVTVTTSQGVPSAPPKAVQCDPLSSQALRVRWNPLPLNLSNGPVQGYKVYYKRTTNIEGSNAVEVKRTTNLETNLQGLGRFTNYSVRVLAFTSAGDGVMSAPSFCATLQDVPGAPSAIRALPAGRDEVLVSWLPPSRPNGVLLQY
ncbi:Down syndrome cell adhesion molecule-like protein Dscam2, partial [Penaeus monodon]|uniref:Down syndrome cell adhesion molecule-like protein Dscam2 n=1 Tax=Penaeus monodon TaxID=6687 RepID=UPI0018A79EFF